MTDYVNDRRFIQQEKFFHISELLNFLVELNQNCLMKMLMKAIYQILYFQWKTYLACISRALSKEARKKIKDAIEVSILMG